MSQKIIEVNINRAVLNKDIQAGYSMKLSSDGKRVVTNSLDTQPRNIPFVPDYVRDQVEQTVRFNSLANYRLTGGRRLNAGETSYLIETLTDTIMGTIDTWYNDTSARSIFNFKSEGFRQGVQALKYVERSEAGIAMVTTENGAGTDMPFVSRSRTSSYSPVFEFQLGAKFTLNELEASMLGMEPLDTTAITDTKKGQERALNNAVFGIGASYDPLTANYPGLFNQLDKCILASDDSALSNWNILTSTATDNRDKLLAVINAPHNFTKNAGSIPTKLTLPIAQANKIKSQPLSADNNDTVAKYILENTSITEIVAAPECQNVGINSVVDALILSNDNEEIHQVQEVMPYTPYDLQQIILDMVLPTRARSAGMFIFKKAIGVVKNCGA